MFMVKSGTGYFVRFADGSPEMTTDPDEAARVQQSEANSIMATLKDLGFTSVLVWEVPVNAVNLMRTVTIYVHVSLKRSSRLRGRLAVGKWLLALAALALNCRLEFETDLDDA